MANTVNDVMNVIASPDYGIKKIAGTTQEILAILEGNSNSPNNINAIVNDVKNLLQTLVASSTKKNKPIEIDDKSVKLNQKHVKDILNETKGIRKAIDNLAKSLNKQGKEPMPAVAKLSSKASDRVAEAMIKDIEKQKGNKFSGIIDTFKKLSDISFKDILIGKLKLNQLSKIFNKASEKLNVNDKDIDAIVKIINSAPEMVKSLSRMNWRIDRIIKKDVIGKLTEVLVGKKSLLTLAKKIEKHKKDFEGGEKSIKNISAIAGSLFSSSLFLVAALVTAGPAILGATLLEKMVDKFIPTIEKLSKSKKHMEKAKKSALTFVAVSGLMAVSSLFLATVAVTGVPALLGSVLMLGIVKITTFTFKMLDKTKTSILKGAIAMVLMSGSLILFGIALKKIVDATKGVGFKQVGIIAAMTVLLGGSVALLGIPVVFPFIALGSVAMGIMSFALLPFAKSLAKISKATKNLKMKHIALITGSMITLGLGVGAMALLLVPITAGSFVLNQLSESLYSFGKSLKLINSIGSVSNKQVFQILDAIKTIGDFFKENPIKRKAIRQARRYKRMLIPFGKTLKHLAKLNEIGTVPMRLVFQTLDAMRTIANYYVENPIERKAIRQARRYKRMLKPFGKTIKYLAKLKELGSIPMKLVHQTLDAISAISDFYREQDLGFFEGTYAIISAKRISEIVSNFGESAISLKPLKDIQSVPLNAINSIIEASNNISSYYNGVVLSDNIEIKGNITEYIINSFSNTSSNMYNKFIDIDVERTNEIKFITKNFIKSFNRIIKYYENTKFSVKMSKVRKINNAIISFTKSANYMKTNLQPFTKKDYNNIKYLIRAIDDILDLFRGRTIIYKKRVGLFKRKFVSVSSHDNIKDIQGRIKLFVNLANAASELSKVDSNNLKSVGESIYSTFDNIGKINMDNVYAVTNMFNAFNSINKSESIIDKFTESVKEFTNTCKDLMDAMNNNTNTINNIDGIGRTTNNEIIENTIVESGNNNSTQNGGVRIANVDEIARTIAEKINGALSVDVPDTQVQLLINGMGGNEWVISRY